MSRPDFSHNRTIIIKSVPFFPQLRKSNRNVRSRVKLIAKDAFDTLVAKQPVSTVATETVAPETVATDNAAPTAAAASGDKSKKHKRGRKSKKDKNTVEQCVEDLMPKLSGGESKTNTKDEEQELLKPWLELDALLTVFQVRPNSSILLHSVL